MVKVIVEDASQLGISKIILGNLRGIRNISHNNNKTNSMMHNFWSFQYITQRFREKAKEYGIKVVEVNEYETSSKCPFCSSRGVRKHRGLFYCPECGKAVNADVVGVLNIAKKCGTIIPNPSWDRDNGLMAQPLLLRWNGMRWEPKRAMNIRPMSTLEARISLLQRGECQVDVHRSTQLFIAGPSHMRSFLSRRHHRTLYRRCRSRLSLPFSSLPQLGNH